MTDAESWMTMLITSDLRAFIRTPHVEVLVQLTEPYAMTGMHSLYNTIICEDYEELPDGVRSMIGSVVSTTESVLIDLKTF